MSPLSAAFFALVRFHQRAEKKDAFSPVTTHVPLITCFSSVRVVQIAPAALAPLSSLSHAHRPRRIGLLRLRIIHGRRLVASFVASRMGHVPLHDPATVLLFFPHCAGPSLTDDLCLWRNQGGCERPVLLLSPLPPR